MRVLVTGGAGFIGSNLCRRLLATDFVDYVTVIDNFTTGYRGNLRSLDVDVLEASILDKRALDRATKGVDAIVHLAARGSVPRSIADPMGSHEVNATGTLAVLEAARRQDAHVVVASSSSVYGASPVLPKHVGLPPRPLSPYAASKLAAEAYTSAYHHSYRLDTLVFRLFNVFGPGQAARHAYAAAIPTFVDAALDGRPVTVHGDGTQSRDFTYVDVVTQVLAEAVRHRITQPQAVNLAFGRRSSILLVLQHLEDQLGKSIRRLHEPRRPGDVHHSEADATQLRELFPEIHPAPLADELAATIDWLRVFRNPDMRRTHFRPRTVLGGSQSEHAPAYE